MYSTLRHRLTINVKLLLTGSAVGFFLAQTLHVRNMFGTIALTISMLIPFSLAALTGVGKTTTA